MSDDSMTGPWALALGTLAIGVAAVVSEVIRQRDDGSEEDERDDE